MPVDYRITTDLAEIDLDVVVVLLQRHSYWANGRPRDVIERSFAAPGVIPFGAIDAAGVTVGCARAVTDRLTFTWLADVIVHPDHRGRGVGKMLVRAAVEHPDLRGVRMVLGTRDAHSLYEQFGFERRELMRRKGGGA